MTTSARSIGGWGVLAPTWLTLVAAATASLWMSARVPAQSSSVRAPDDRQSGWLVRFGSDADSPSAVMANAAFALGAGETLDPRVPAKDFSAKFDGVVAIDQPGRYRFVVEMEGGEGLLRVFGKSAPGVTTLELKHAPQGLRTEWIALKEGEVNITIEFKRRSAAKARLRMMWECERGSVSELGVSTATGFALEALNAWRVRIPALGTEIATRHQSAFRGRVLLSEMGCTYCHTGGFGGGMAILARPGPLLQDVASRVDPAYLKSWILDPQSMKPGCGMPAVFRLNDESSADAIVHYLASIAQAPFESGSVTSGESGLQRGEDLFNSIGCAVCHGESAGKSQRALQSPPPHPYGNLSGKWGIEALSAFLLDPAACRPAGRMPNMQLSQAEADLLANYLRSSWGDRPGRHTPFLVDSSKATQGKMLFESSGCVGCHQLGERFEKVESTLKAPSLIDAAKRVGRGCMDAKSETTPRYTLTNAQRADLAVALSEAASWGQSRAPLDEAARRIESLNCRSCHEYDGSGGVAAHQKHLFRQTSEADLGDEGRLPPSLTGAGGKLNTAWTRQVLFEGGRVRPYMATRMPQFGPVGASQLAEGLSQTDGVWPDSDAREPTVSDDMVTAGRTLAGTGGLNCISCHVVGEHPPAGTPGPDMTRFAGRLRYDWWSRYINNPQRFKPGTRMTSFFQSGTSQVTGILDGNPSRQADALWQYFTLGENMPAPDGLPTAGSLAISVGNRPVVMRSFLRSAGVRGIAVGYPGNGPHFAFDAGRCRLTEVWSGAFVDMSGSWAGRGGTTLDGQGESLWRAPDGPAFQIVGIDAEFEFDGYQLDEDGVPSFLYHLALGDDRIRITDRVEPSTSMPTHMQRSLRFEGPLSGKQLRILAGKVFRSDGLLHQENQGPQQVYLFSQQSASIQLEIGP